ncbi:hypothetical protein G9A89_003729 [Geosiphon pyriformis]|nr:hypothetical protein G9A89_003729 [Geosiphon pyriformis]
MITTRAKSKKVANITFLIVTNKVSTQEGLSVIETDKQNILATFSLKNISKKLSLAASDLFSLSLIGSFSSVKVSSKRHTWVNPNVVSTTFKNPKIFNNRPVNKLVFLAFTTSTTTTTTTTTTFASQMAAKAKNSKKQQQTVTTAMILGKISTTAASPLLNMNGNSNGSTLNMKQNQLLAVLSDVVISSRFFSAMKAKQFIISNDLKNWANQIEIKSSTPSPVSGWVVSILVPDAIFKIKMAFLSFLFQLLFGCIGLKSKSLTGATKVVIGNEIFLTTLKIAQSFGVVSVFFPPLSVALYKIPLSIFFDNIKSALGVFGVVTSVKLKSAGLWQYTVIHFKDTFSTAAVLTHWSVLVRKDSIRILSVVNQNDVISSKDAFKAKLVNLLFGCTAFEISVTLLLFVVFSSLNVAVNARLASLQFYLGELSLLIKSLVESIGVLVVLVIKLLSALPTINVSVKKNVTGLAKQNKGFAVITSMLQKRIVHLKKKCKKTCLEDVSDNDNMDNNNNNNVKNFSVYDVTFDLIINL